MSVKTTVEYMGDLGCKALHEQSGSIIETEAPLDNHGRGTKFSPTDLVCAAVGSCILTIMGITADREKVNIKGAKVLVTKEMASNPRRIGRIDAVIVMPKGISLTDIQKKKFENSAKTCPVKATLHPDTEINIVFEY